MMMKVDDLKLSGLSLNRRNFLKLSAGATALVVVPLKLPVEMDRRVHACWFSGSRSHGCASSNINDDTLRQGESLIQEMERRNFPGIKF